MKAVIVEIKEKYAAALFQDGSVVRVADKNYQTGQIVNLKKETVRFRQRAIAMAATVVAIVCVSGATAYAYTDPYSYVSVDVNPSVAFNVNRFDQVINSQAVDSEGAAVLSHLDLKNKNIHEAITQVLNEIKKEGYFSGSDVNGIVISTCSGDQGKTDQLRNALQNDVQDELKDEGVNADVEAVGVGRERVAEAQSMGVTPGKLNLVEKLQASASDPGTIDAKEWLNRPVRDIMKQIKENGKDHKALDSGNGKGQSEPSSQPTGKPSGQSSASESASASNSHQPSVQGSTTAPAATASAESEKSKNNENGKPNNGNLKNGIGNNGNNNNSNGNGNTNGEGNNNGNSKNK
ncbi:MAG: hypothetical protein WCP73_02320 [Eubacteriales bacterium]